MHSDVGHIDFIPNAPEPKEVDCKSPDNLKQIGHRPLDLGAFLLDQGGLDESILDNIFSTGTAPDNTRCYIHEVQAIAEIDVQNLL